MTTALTESLKLLLACLKIGTVVFGGGMVMIPLLHADVVEHNAWLTEQEFVDAVALGQMTPGPLLVTATFVGWKVGGPALAVLATVCVFLPSFAMTVGASKRLKALRENRRVQDFLWGVKAAVVGLIIGSAYTIAVSAVGQAATTPDRVQMGLLGVGSLVVLLTTKLDAGIVVIACGAIGMASWALQTLV